MAFDTAEHAARAALSAVSTLEEFCELRIAAHYAIAHRLDYPFGGEPFLAGPASAVPKEILLSTPAGAIHVTEDFAAALHAGPVLDWLRTEYVGEMPGDDVEDPVRLFSLRR